MERLLFKKKERLKTKGVDLPRKFVTKGRERGRLRREKG